jgi:RNA polymerase sigma-70 factor (ECF subfamily)
VAALADERLLERLRDGEAAAFDQLYNDYHGLICNVAYRILGEREEAFDVTQEVYLSIFKNIRGFNGASSLKTWIYRITVNACLNRNRWWKRRKKNAMVPLGYYHPEDTNGFAETLRDNGVSPEEQAFRSELEGRIQEGLQNLAEEQRVAVILRDLEGLSYEEIAEALRISMGTVKSRIARGREHLRNGLRGILQP